MDRVEMLKRKIGARDWTKGGSGSMRLHIKYDTYVQVSVRYEDTICILDTGVSEIEGLKPVVVDILICRVYPCVELPVRIFGSTQFS